MSEYLGIGDGENVVYADDSNVWQMGSNVEEVVRKLREKAALFVDYTRSMGLSMNASTTQLLLSANAGNVASVTMEVERHHGGGQQHHLPQHYHRNPGSRL
jgi:hypothetical protein